jgi:small subunit ribosomal protein S1
VPKDKEGNPLKGFQIKDKRIGLPIRKLEESSERDVHRSYVTKQKQAMSNLRELLIEKMMGLQPQISLESRESDK